MDGPLKVVSDFRSVDEFTDAYLRLDVDEWNQVRRIAASFALKVGEQADDLIQQASMAVLENRRRWPADQPLVAFLAGVMRSLASGAKEMRARSPYRSAVSMFGPDGELAFDPESPDTDPEQMLIAAELVDRVLSGLEHEMEGDDASGLILLGMRDGDEGEPLREATGLSKVAFASRRRQVRRRVDACIEREKANGRR